MVTYFKSKEMEGLVTHKAVNAMIVIHLNTLGELTMLAMDCIVMYEVHVS